MEAPISRLLQATARLCNSSFWRMLRLLRRHGGKVPAPNRCLARKWRRRDRSLALRVPPASNALACPLSPSSPSSPPHQPPWLRTPRERPALRHTRRPRSPVPLQPVVSKCVPPIVIPAPTSLPPHATRIAFVFCPWRDSLQRKVRTLVMCWANGALIRAQVPVVEGEV